MPASHVDIPFWICFSFSYFMFSSLLFSFFYDIVNLLSVCYLVQPGLWHFLFPCMIIYRAPSLRVLPTLLIIFCLLFSEGNANVSERLNIQNSYGESISSKEAFKTIQNTKTRRFVGTIALLKPSWWQVDCAFVHADRSGNLREITRLVCKVSVLVYLPLFAGFLCRDWQWFHGCSWLKIESIFLHRLVFHATASGASSFDLSLQFWWKLLNSIFLARKGQQDVLSIILFFFLLRGMLVYNLHQSSALSSSVLYSCSFFPPVISWNFHRQRYDSHGNWHE